jgi:hypothetical protein
LPKALSSPTTWHYVSLGAGLVVILLLQASQWFFFDEWAFLQLDGPGLLEPHVGHWSTSPLLIYRGLREIVGLHTYVPYIVLVTLIHLAIAHLVWRITLRSGSNRWVATAAVTVLIFLGAGAENILWAFQAGFLGAIALGLLAFWLATTEALTTRRLVAIVLISVFALTWAGTAIPLVVGTAFVLWRRHDWRRMLVYVAVCASVYLAWYLAFALPSPSNPDTGGFGLHKLFIEMPLFLGVMFVLGFGKVFPVVGVGALVLVLVGIWLIRLLIRKAPLHTLVPALGLVLSAAAFALLTSYSRALFSLGAGQSSRYIYTLLVLLLPLLAVAASVLAARWRRGVLVASIALLALAAYQAVLLVQASADQAALERVSERRLSAAITLYIDDPLAVDPNSLPDGQWAPDLSMRDLEKLYEGGYFVPIDVSDADRAAAELAVGAGN